LTRPPGPYKMLKKLHKTLTARSNQELVLIANALFSQRGFPVEESFMAANKANFQCENSTVDFSDTHAAADLINSWVNNKTKGRRYRACGRDKRLSYLIQYINDKLVISIQNKSY